MRPLIILIFLVVAATAPGALRQGGDTIADATVIASLPFADNGTTVGYNDDYDALCPTEGQLAPDVVYSFTPEQVRLVVIDLCGSAYNTRVWVFDPDLEIIACNDDYYADGDPCGPFVSRLDALTLDVGRTYYIVIDGFDGAEGEYTLEIGETPVTAPGGTWTSVRVLYR